MTRRLEFGKETGRKPPYRYSALTRVAFSETDAQGIVYYGRYMPYFDLARVEYHRHLGLPGVKAGGHDFVMRANTLEYFAPARYDDWLEMGVRVLRLGRSSLTFQVAIWREEQPLTLGELIYVYADEERQSQPVPDWLRERIRAFERTPPAE